MTEFAFYLNSLSRAWNYQGGECRVEVENNNIINVIDFRGHCFLSLFFDDQGNLINLDGE